MFLRLVSYLKKNKILLLASFLFLVIRLPFLDHAFLLRGERDIALTGYFLAKTGKDLYGNGMPIEFFGLDMPTPFLAFYYSALWWIIIPIKNVFFARIPYVIATTVYVFLVYEIVHQITKHKILSVLTALVFSFSPGIYHLSRLALEVNIATPLLFAAILLYLKKYRFYSYLFFILVYFSYSGFRPLVLPLLLFLEFYWYLQGEKLKKVITNSIISVVFFFVIVGVGLYFVDGGLTLSRKDDVVFFNTQELTERVNYKRNTSIGPNLLDKLFFNKATLSLHYMINVFVQGQGFEYLFSKGDDAAIYASTFTGQFFLLMFPLYYLGFVFLAKKWKREFLYLLGFIPIGLVPSLINIDYISFTIRSILSTVGFAYIIAGGMIFTWSLIKNQKSFIRNGIIVVATFIIAIEISYFGYNYIFRRPVTMFEFFFESERDLADYLNNNKKNYFIYDDSPRNIVATYYFLQPELDVSKAQNILKKESPYSVNGTIIRKCPATDEKLILKPKTIVAESCLDENQYQILGLDPAVDKIEYEDYSFKSAYFIINSSVPKVQ